MIQIQRQSHGLSKVVEVASSKGNAKDRTPAASLYTSHCQKLKNQTKVKGPCININQRKWNMYVPCSKSMLPCCSIKISIPEIEWVGNGNNLNQSKS